MGGLNTRVFLLCITYCYPIAKIRAYLERENTLVISLHEHVLTSECLKDARIVYFMIRAYFAKIGGWLIVFCVCDLRYNTSILYQDGGGGNAVFSFQF